ncbi:MAG TPA: antibiotic biosynthesis monooxygenase family protein [Pyrinomonadaceae bacterium]|nr:antibiotic biosynthesis monooxygenase family protein [Pyrinomonadaceae bacterium]
MVLNTSSVTVFPEKREEFLQTITQLLEPINGAAGCKRFRLYVDVADENSSLLLGEWESEADLDNYLRSADHAILHGAIMILGKQRNELKAIVD